MGDRKNESYAVLDPQNVATAISVVNRVGYGRIRIHTSAMDRMGAQYTTGGGDAFVGYAGAGPGTGTAAAPSCTCTADTHKPCSHAA